MDKLAKLLRKLTARERQHLERVLEALISGDTAGLDIKKLKGTEDIYRIRVEQFRVIFQKDGATIRILEASRRDEGTYRNY